MSQYFSLIQGGKITRGIQDKVINSESFSELLSSHQVLEKVKQDAIDYKKKVASECEPLKDAAEKAGFEAGYQAWVQQISYLENEIKKVREEMMKLCMPVALKAARKICASELETHPDVILDIVTNTLKSVAQHRRIVLYVNKRDFDILEKNKGSLKTIFEQLESLSIRDRDDIEQGGCVVETEGGIINAQLQDRWRSLETAFESLAGQLFRKEG